MCALWMGLGLGVAFGVSSAAFACEGSAAACWVAVLLMQIIRLRNTKARRGHLHAAVWVAGLGLLLGVWRFESVTSQPGHALLAELAQQGKTIRIRGCIVAEPDVKSSKAVALDVLATEAAVDETGWVTVPPTRCRIVLLAGRGTNVPPVQTRLPWVCCPEAYGYQVRIQGLRPQKAKDPKASIREKAEPVVLLGHWTGCRVSERTEGHPVMEYALEVKERLLLGFSRRLTDRSSRLAAGMTLGDKAAVYGADYHGWPMRDLFARAGIAHLLAVSGSNVGVLAVSVCGLLSIVGLSRRWILLPAFLVVVTYTLMTGLPASAQRAAIMTSVGLVVWALPSFKMPGSLYLGLGLSAALILLRDPEELFRPGFQLSYLAVITLAVGTPAVDGWMLSSSRPQRGGKNETMVGQILKAARIFLAAQIAIQLGLNIPASAVYFGHYSFAGWLVNLAAIPLAAVLTPGSLLVGLLDMIPVMDPWLAAPVAWCMERAFDLFLWISATCAAHLPYPEVDRWPWWGVAVYYAALIVVVLRARRAPDIAGDTV